MKIVLFSRLVGLASLLLGLFCAPAEALDPRTSLVQAQHTAWTSADGAPSQVEDLAQTSDGFLWVASSSGLSRFDGSRFQAVSLSDKGQSEPDITALFATGANELWVGTRRSGVYHLRGGVVLAHLGTENGLPRATVYSLRKDNAERVWAASSAGVFLLRDGHFQRVWPTANSTSLPAANLARDAQGTLCFTTDGAVWCKAAHEAEFHSTFTGEVEDLALNSSGTFQVWISGEGVKPLQHGDSSAQAIPSSVPHGHCVFTRSGDLYFLTYGAGLIRVTQRTGTGAQAARYMQERFSSGEGLQSPYLSSLLEDREGNIWIGTTRGLERFRNGRFVPLPLLAGVPDAVLLPENAGTMWIGRRVHPLLLANASNDRLPDLPDAPKGITAAFRDEDGTAWFGASPLLWHIRGGRRESLHLPEYVQGSSDVQAIGRDAEGTLWVSVVRFGTMLYRDGRWSRTNEGGNADAGSYANAFLLDSQKRFWAAAHGGVELRTISGRRTLHVGDGFDFGDVYSFVDEAGAVFAGGERGLGVFLHERFLRIQTDADQLLRGVSGMVVSQDGALWLHCSQALLRIAPEELQTLRNETQQRLHVQIFSFADGLPGLAPGVRPFPSLQLASDGRLWVSTGSGVAWIDTLHYPRNEVPPTVQMDTVQAGDTIYPVKGMVHLPPRSRGIRLNWSAPSLSVRDGVHFRTRLVGLDTEWQNVGTAHSVTYASLPAGRYRFEVEAGNEDDVWNRTGEGFAIEVQPAFYQRLWFRLLTIAVALLILWEFYRIRIRAITARVRDLMAERLAERERIAAELHDTLLQSVQGLILLFSGVAAQLPTESRVADAAESAIQRAEALLAEGRDSVRDLRSKNISLREAFRSLRDGFAGSRTQYTFEIQGEQPELQLTVADEIYKIAREAVRNASQHADATQVALSLVFSARGVDLLVRDDGTGMNDELLQRGRAGHWGLQGMVERADKLRGKLQVQSRPGQGTTVRLTVPASMAYRRTSLNLRERLHGFRLRIQSFLFRKEQG